MSSIVIQTMVGVLIFIYQSVCNSKNVNCNNELLTECKCSELKDIFMVDCSNIRVKSVPLGIPPRTTHLYLNNNEIKVLHNNSFAYEKGGLPNLVVLSIRSNAMSRVEIYALKGLHNLKDLDLYDNSLELEDSFPSSVFVPITQSLEILDIRRNLLGDITQMDYPLSVGELVGLKELRIDCLRNKSLPMEYGKMKNLTKLSFAYGRKEIGFIRDDMFLAVSKSGITDVNLGGLDIGIIGNDTFLSLPKLRTLDLSNNPYVINYVENIIPSLKKTSIRTLNLNHTGIGHVESIRQILKALGELNLKELTMDNNAIEKLDPVFSQYLPDLEVLSFGNNFIDFDVILINDFFNLKNLTGLNMSWQNMNGINSYDTKVQGKKRQGTKNTKPGNNVCNPDMACPVMLPSQIEWIHISHFGGDVQFIPELVILANSTLHSIDLSHNRITIIKNPVYCPGGKFNVVTQIQTINLNNNGLQYINSSFFSHCNWSSLINLHLTNNQLGRTEGDVQPRNNNTLGFLKPATNLEYLDLARNLIQNESELSALQGLVKLKVIDLSNNRLNNFSFSLKNMTGLLRVNLSNNNIRCLSMSTTLQFNKLQKLRTNSDTIEVDLSGNLLSCTCGCFDFFKWMKITKVVLTNLKKYKCEFNNGTKITLDSLPYIVAALESLCFGTKWLKIYISLEILNYFLITITCLLCRARRTIKRLLNVYLRLSALEEQKNIQKETKYVFSAFVSCDHRDAKYFVHRKLLPNLETKESKLIFCIAQRNFLVGATIIDNIIRAISKSRKVIFVVSQYFLKSKWCQEELLIAHQVCIEWKIVQNNFLGILSCENIRKIVFELTLSS